MMDVNEKIKKSLNNKDKDFSTLKKIGKILNYIGKILSYACIVLLVLIGIFLVYYVISIQKAKKDPNFKPTVSLYTIISGSMEPTIHVYDVVLNQAVNNPEEIKVGDVITFISTSSISEGLTVTHRVQDIKIINGEYEFVTKGDYNPAPDSSTAKYGNVIGRVIFKIPQLGRVQFFVASKIGWFFVVLLPAMGVIIYDVLKLFKLLGTKKTFTKINGKNKNNDIKVDKAIHNIKKNDYDSSLLDDLKESIIVSKDINIKNNDDNDNSKLNEDIHLTKEDYLNRLNALKKRNN